MKKSIITLIFLMVFCSTAICQEVNKNAVGMSVGVVPPIMDMYFGEPWDFYPNRETSPLINVFYTRQVLPVVRVGIYGEFEKVRFTDQSATDTHSFRRKNFGLNVIVHFPEKPFHFQVGGYAGYGLLKADNWSDLHGFDFGGLFGPAYEKNHLGIALHVQSGYGGYTSDGTPGEVKLYNPKLLLKGYFRF